MIKKLTDYLVLYLLLNTNVLKKNSRRYIKDKGYSFLVLDTICNRLSLPFTVFERIVSVVAVCHDVVLQAHRICGSPATVRSIGCVPCVSPILFPIRWIVFDIQRDQQQFIVVADDMVVEPGLPCERDVLPVKGMSLGNTIVTHVAGRGMAITGKTY